MPRFRSAIPAGLLWFAAAAAAADPLDYPIRGNVLTVVMDGEVRVTYNPLTSPPVSHDTIGAANLIGQPTGEGVADVGLPLSFMGGGHGLLLAAFDATTQFSGQGLLLTDVFAGLPPIPGSPIPLAGAAFLLQIADLEVTLDGPLSSSLVRTDANQFSWAGEAPVTIAGTLAPVLLIPGQAPIPAPASGAFSVSAPGALLGAFSGDDVSTTLDVGLEPVEVTPDTDVLTQPIVVQLGAVGSVSVVPNRLRIRVDGSFTGVNRQYGLPPSRGGGLPPACGIGPELALLMAALGGLSRRRRAA